MIAGQRHRRSDTPKVHWKLSPPIQDVIYSTQVIQLQVFSLTPTARIIATFNNVVSVDIAPEFSADGLDEPPECAPTFSNEVLIGLLVRISNCLIFFVSRHWRNLFLHKRHVRFEFGDNSSVFGKLDLNQVQRLNMLWRQLSASRRHQRHKHCVLARPAIPQLVHKSRCQNSQDRPHHGTNGNEYLAVAKLHNCPLVRSRSNQNTTTRKWASTHPKEESVPGINLTETLRSAPRGRKNQRRGAGATGED